MTGRFWFGFTPPTEYRDPAIQDYLAFNGQLHFCCASCHEVTWADITFGKAMMKGGRIEGLCPNCRKGPLEVIKFVAVALRSCLACGAQTFSAPQDAFSCKRCGGEKFILSATWIDPPYPVKLFILLTSDHLGSSVSEDIKFLSEYIKGLRMSPEFHQACTYFVSFIESLFEDLYRSSPEAVDLLNVASAVMRTVFRETGNPDAAYLSIATMIRGREMTMSDVQSAVFGLNICQNVYSVLARRLEPILSLRFGYPLKAYSVELARHTVQAFEAIKEPWVDEVRARSKWLLGDLLKACDPTEAEISESLIWFDAALEDKGLPRDAIAHVRESALAARQKRGSLTSDQREEIRAEMAELAAASLATSEGLERVRALEDLLRSRSRAKRGDWEDMALTCFGETILYTVANDPKNMLRHSGTVLSNLVSGFAAERLDYGVPLDAMAAVEAFRSLSIFFGEASEAVGRKVQAVEQGVLVSALFGTRKSPTEVAQAMLTEYRNRIEEDLRTLLTGSDRLLLWFELWEESLLVVKVELVDQQLRVLSAVKPLQIESMMAALRLPDAEAPPGRLRATRVANALALGWPSFQEWLDVERIDRECLWIGPSLLSNWPIDAAETSNAAPAKKLRPVTFSPAIRVAGSMRSGANVRSGERVLTVGYGGADLPGTRLEIEKIRAAYDGRATILDEGALIKANILAALSDDYDIVHFCGHGEFDFMQPMDSRIYFKHPCVDEGFLTAEDIQNCKKIGRCPIVVLCACTSAAVLPNGANNFLGLAGALIRAGASAIVGARWPISDGAGVNFSSVLHQELAKGVSASVATARAKESIRATARLDDWGAFLCIGG